MNFDAYSIDFFSPPHFTHFQRTLEFGSRVVDEMFIDIYKSANNRASHIYLVVV